MNQNNRRRAYVTVDSINVDLMIDGLIQQNRALDGDTVIIELYEPVKWTEYANTNLVVGQNATGKTQNLFTQNGVVGYTNETAVESRVIDQETLGNNSTNTKEVINLVNPPQNDISDEKNQGA